MQVLSSHLFELTWINCLHWIVLLIVIHLMHGQRCRQKCPSYQEKVSKSHKAAKLVLYDMATHSRQFAKNNDILSGLFLLFASWFDLAHLY